MAWSKSTRIQRPRAGRSALAEHDGDPDRIRRSEAAFVATDEA
jgi:hypothetical protein